MVSACLVSGYVRELTERGGDTESQGHLRVMGK